MPESDIAQKMTKLIKAVDRLVRDLIKDAEKLRELMKELKEE